MLKALRRRLRRVDGNAFDGIVPILGVTRGHEEFGQVQEQEQLAWRQKQFLILEIRTWYERADLADDDRRVLGLISKDCWGPETRAVGSAKAATSRRLDALLPLRQGTHALSQ